MKKYPSNSGTTLLEVMIAVAVASIALISFITLVITATDVEGHARKVTEATIIADDKLKEVERTGFPEIGRTEGQVEDEQHEGFTYTLTVSPTPIIQVRQVDVEVFWENGKRSVNLMTLIARE